MRAEDLVIDIDDDFSGDVVLPELGARRHSLRPRFLPHQARVDARIGAIDRGIRDTYLQQGLKDHPFATGVEGRGTLYFFLSHSDSCYMHVLTNSL